MFGKRKEEKKLCSLCGAVRTGEYLTCDNCLKALKKVNVCRICHIQVKQVHDSDGRCNKCYDEWQRIIKNNPDSLNSDGSRVTEKQLLARTEAEWGF